MFTLLMSSSSTGFLGLSTGFSSTGEAASKGCRALVQSQSGLKLRQHQLKQLLKLCNTKNLSRAAYSEDTENLSGCSN